MRSTAAWIESEICELFSYLPAPSKLFLCVLQFGAGATIFCCPEDPKPGIELNRFSFLRCFADMDSCA